MQGRATLKRPGLGLERAGWFALGLEPDSAEWLAPGLEPGHLGWFGRAWSLNDPNDSPGLKIDRLEEPTPGLKNPTALNGLRLTDAWQPRKVRQS